MNRASLSNLYWGLLLIAAGVVFLLFNVGLELELDENLIALLLGVTSVLTVVGYLIGDRQKWYLLLPAAGLAAGALAIYLENRERADNIIGVLSALLVSIPFWVAFIVDRSKNRWALIPGLILTAAGIMIGFFSENEEQFAAVFFLGLAAAFLIVFLTNRSRWWALIPAYVFLILSLVTAFADQLSGDLLGTLFMWVIALPFLVVFLANRRNWWALIPAYALGIIGLIVLLADQNVEGWIATIIMLSIAFPFFLIFLINRQNWWALVPAGILASIGLGLVFAFLDLSEDATERAVVAVILGGTAITFGVIWLNRKRSNGDWAKYPAVGCALAAIVVLIFGARMELIWGFGLMALGGWILYRSRSKIKTSDHTEPHDVEG